MGSSRKTLIVIAVAAGLLVLAFSAARQLYLLHREADRLDDMRAILDTAMDGAKELESKLKLLDEEIAKMGFVKVDLYFAKMSETEVYIEPVRRVVDKEKLAFNAVSLLIKGPGENDEGLYPVAPKGVEVLGVTERAGVAYADFSEGIMHAGLGSEGELAMVAAIVNTLCALPGIEKVQILVEGNKVESLGGHVLVEEPLSRMVDLLKQ